MNKFWKVLSSLAVAVALLPLSACDDEDYSSNPGQPDYNVNYVYMYEPLEMYSTIDFKATGEFMKDLSNPLDLTPVRCTKAAPADIVVKVRIDESLVETYNEANNTDCDFLTGVQLTSDTYVIPKGQYMSAEYIAMNVVDRSKLENSHRDLVLPIIIESATGADVTISRHSRVFIRFVYKANFISVASTANLYVKGDESTWPSQLADMTASDVITATWGADSKITFNAEIDPSLVETFNQSDEGALTYKMLPGAQLAQPIELGEGEALTSIRIKTASEVTFANDEHYVVPVKINSVDGIGAELVEAPTVCYILVSYMPPTITLGTPEGSEIPYSPSLGWTLTVNGNSSVDGYDWAQTLYGCLDYVDMWSQGDVVVCDLQETYNLTGMWMRFYAWYYAMNGFSSFEYSVDGEVWGKLHPAFEWNYNESNSLKFEKTIQARYIRFAVGAGFYYSDMYATGLKFYQE